MSLIFQKDAARIAANSEVSKHRSFRNITESVAIGFAESVGFVQRCMVTSGSDSGCYLVKYRG